MATRKDHVVELFLKAASFNASDTQPMPFPQLVLVRGGKRAYLWLGWKGRCLGTLHGPATLRKLARAILDEVPPIEKRKAKPVTPGKRTR